MNIKKEQHSILFSNLFLIGHICDGEMYHILLRQKRRAVETLSDKNLYPWFAHPANTWEDPNLNTQKFDDS